MQRQEQEEKKNDDNHASADDDVHQQMLDGEGGMMRKLCLQTCKTLGLTPQVTFIDKVGR